MAVALARALEDQRAQVRVAAVFFGRDGEVRELAGQFVEAEGAAFGDVQRVVDGFGIGCEDAGHLGRALQVEFMIW